MYKLKSSLVDRIDYAGYAFLVTDGETFEADDFSAFSRVSEHDIDPQEIKRVQDEAARLTPGQILRVDLED